jgi:K+-sensing histidine kinase KdpD
MEMRQMDQIGVNYVRESYQLEEKKGSISAKIAAPRFILIAYLVLIHITRLVKLTKLVKLQFFCNTTILLLGLFAIFAISVVRIQYFW